MAMTKNLTCLADGTAFGKQEWVKSGPRQSAKAGKAAGITAVGKQFWSPRVRRVNSGGARKQVMLKLSICFRSCTSWEGKAAKK